MKKKGLDTTTMSIFGISDDKPKNGYPAQDRFGEGRRMPKEELLQLEQVDNDWKGNNYEIYAKPGNHGQVRHYNSRGREVIHNPERSARYKIKRGPNADAEMEAEEQRRHALPKWVEKETYWDKSDVAKYIDSLTDEDIKLCGYWSAIDYVGMGDTKVLTPIKEMSTLVRSLWMYDKNFQNLSSERDRVKKCIEETITPGIERLEALILLIEDKDLDHAVDLLRMLDFPWLNILSDHMRYAGVYDRMKNLHKSEVLKVKRVRAELKRILPQVQIPDDRPIWETRELKGRQY